MRNTAILIVLTVLLFSAAAKAEIVTIAIEGIVDSVVDDDNQLEGNINVGDPITGWYKYDSLTQDTNPLPTVGDYLHTTIPHGMYLTVGGFEFQTNPANVDLLIEIANNHGLGQRDNFLVRSSDNLPLYNGVGIDSIRWQLDDESGTALLNTNIPTTAPDLSKWLDGNTLRMKLDRGYTISGHITNAYVIPEPATVLLFGLGVTLIRKRK